MLTWWHHGNEPLKNKYSFYFGQLNTELGPEVIRVFQLCKVELWTSLALLIHTMPEYFVGYISSSAAMISNVNGKCGKFSSGYYSDDCSNFVNCLYLLFNLDFEVALVKCSAQPVRLS